LGRDTVSAASVAACFNDASEIFEASVIDSEFQQLGHQRDPKLPVIFV
jgi:hypothetical protein